MVIGPSDNTDARDSDVHLTLSRSDAERLHVLLPGLLRALADRPTATPRQRELRRDVSTILERLQTGLASQFPKAEENGESQ